MEKPSGTPEEHYIHYLEFMVEELTEACGPAGDDVYSIIRQDYINKFGDIPYE